MCLSFRDMIQSVLFLQCQGNSTVRLLKSLYFSRYISLHTTKSSSCLSLETDSSTCLPEKRFFITWVKEGRSNFVKETPVVKRPIGSNQLLHGWGLCLRVTRMEHRNLNVDSQNDRTRVNKGLGEEVYVRVVGHTNTTNTSFHLDFARNLSMTTDVLKSFFPVHSYLRIVL